MTIAVDLGRKATRQNIKKIIDQNRSVPNLIHVKKWDFYRGIFCANDARFSLSIYFLRGINLEGSLELQSTLLQAEFCTLVFFSKGKL